MVSKVTVLLVIILSIDTTDQAFIVCQRMCLTDINFFSKSRR